MSILSKMSKLFKVATNNTKSNDVEIDELIQFSNVADSLEDFFVNEEGLYVFNTIW